MILSSLRDRSPDSNVDLTPREQQALRHIAYGLSNEEIAQSMSISIETVKEYVQNILRKLRVKDRTQAAVWAVRKGVV
jgi:DNA-binding NarL/FixJ family response regulator